MTNITKPMPLYEGFLALATAAEHRAILAGGPRQHLDHKLVFFTDDDEQIRVEAAFAAIRSILLRIEADPSLGITGLDGRLGLPRREPIEAELVRAGRLMWEGREGERSALQLDHFGQTIRIIDLRIEPLCPPASLPSQAMTTSNRLRPGERKDDTDRLLLMQKYIDDGRPPKTAARLVAAELPDRPTSEDSLTTRLMRKFGERKKS